MAGVEDHQGYAEARLLENFGQRYQLSASLLTSAPGSQYDGGCVGVDLVDNSMGSDVNDGVFEPFGRPELRLRIFGGNSNIFTGSGPTGIRIVDPLFNPNRRSINGRWWNLNHRLLFWYERYGSILTYRWEEEDNPIFDGSGDTISFNIALEYNGQGYGANVTFPRGAGDDYIGTTIVDKDECGREYSVGAVQFRLSF
jgi:hypothetical protein